MFERQLVVLLTLVHHGVVLLQRPGEEKKTESSKKLDTVLELRQ